MDIIEVRGLDKFLHKPAYIEANPYIHVASAIIGAKMANHMVNKDGMAPAAAAEDAREHIGFPIDHVGIVVTTRGDQPDVLGNRGVRGTGPLAVDDFVKVIRVADIGGLH